MECSPNRRCAQSASAGLAKLNYCRAGCLRFSLMGSTLRPIRPRVESICGLSVALVANERLFHLIARFVALYRQHFAGAPFYRGHADRRDGLTASRMAYGIKKLVAVGARPDWPPIVIGRRAMARRR
jgi:hypothetical protein